MGEYSNYPDYVDSRFDVTCSESCNTCAHNFKNSNVIINLNPICAHCNRCQFVKSDLFVQERNNGKH